MNRLKELRKRKGYSQEVLGKMIGSNKSYISDLENNKRLLSGLRQETLAKLSNALECRCYDLFVDLQFEDNRILIDGIFYNPQYQKMMYRYEDFYFIFRSDFNYRMSLEQALDRIIIVRNGKGIAEGKKNEIRWVQNYVCTPVTPIDVTWYKESRNEKRFMKDKELEEFLAEFNLSRDCVTEIYERKSNSFFGIKKMGHYAKYIQIKINDMSMFEKKEYLDGMNIDYMVVGDDSLEIRVSENVFYGDEEWKKLEEVE